MKTILKFKGKVHGQWWYVTWDSKNGACDSWEQFWAISDPKTICRWTGLRDLKKQDIYENDIIGYFENNGNFVYPLKSGVSRSQANDLFELAKNDKEEAEIFKKVYDEVTLLSAYYVYYDNSEASFGLKEKLLNDDDDFFTDNQIVEDGELLLTMESIKKIAGNILDKYQFDSEYLINSKYI